MAVMIPLCATILPFPVILRRRIKPEGTVPGEHSKSPQLGRGPALGGTVSHAETFSRFKSPPYALTHSKKALPTALTQELPLLLKLLLLRIGRCRSDCRRGVDASADNQVTARDRTLSTVVVARASSIASSLVGLRTHSKAFVPII